MPNFRITLPISLWLTGSSASRNVTPLDPAMFEPPQGLCLIVYDAHGPDMSPGRVQRACCALAVGTVGRF
jgi:hypothetical protein